VHGQADQAAAVSGVDGAFESGQGQFRLVHHPSAGDGRSLSQNL
jgi:hypothetical protein